MLKQYLTQKQQQKLSPAQIQQIKMLELNSLEMDNRICQELEENPALEDFSDSFSDPDMDETADENEYDASGDKNNADDADDYLMADDIPYYALNQRQNTETNYREIPYSESESFGEYLLNQLRLKNLSEEKIRIGEYIIGNIDDDGYLRRDPESLSDDLAFQYGLEVQPEAIREIADLIRQLDPAGIGASDIRECLLLQLQRKEKTPERRLAILLLQNYFESFSKKKYDKILNHLNGVKGGSFSEEDLKNAIREITLLNPRPGNSWESNTETKMSQITPDFIVEATNGGELFFSLPEESTPELRISREYSEMMTSYAQSSGKENAATRDAFAFVKQKIDSAKWFIDAIKQRNTTLRQTMKSIIEIQRDFFLTGDESALKPMKLRDVSELCGYDISTVSRVSNSKYVQTNWGVYSLRFFFSDGITNEEGEEVSVREIKTLLKSFIDTEDKTKPMSDDVLMSKLKQEGYDIARRTVAKYREQLNIPVARLRKEII